MNELDIIQQIKLGEVSKVQFKERILDNYDTGCELVSFSNARGGTLVVGVKAKTGSVNPLSYQEVQETTNALSNIASENVIPPFYKCHSFATLHRSRQRHTSSLVWGCRCLVH